MKDMAIEIVRSGEQYLNGADGSPRWYQQLQNIVDMRVPVRLSVQTLAYTM
jgi:hypothetical protein